MSHADRITVLVEACSLAGALRRNLLLTLAEAEVFRLRWSNAILDETEAAIETILRLKAVPDAAVRAARARRFMEDAFEDAMVSDFDTLLPAGAALPDKKDAHVLAAAIKTRADVIVTENLKHFPTSFLNPLGIQARSADAFITDAISQDVDRALRIIGRMRADLSNPAITAEGLLLRMEGQGLVETVAVLRPHVHAL